MSPELLPQWESVPPGLLIGEAGQPGGGVKPGQQGEASEPGQPGGQPGEPDSSGEPGVQGEPASSSGKVVASQLAEEMEADLDELDQAFAVVQVVSDDAVVHVDSDDEQKEGDAAVQEKLAELAQGEASFDQWVKKLTHDQKAMIIKAYYEKTPQWSEVWRYLQYVKSTQSNQGCGKCRYQSCEKCDHTKSQNYILRHGGTPAWWKIYKKAASQGWYTWMYIYIYIYITLN